ncbi:hypothetical protein AZE42_12255 [Rhizopogon vesiculosus]|uniref:Uncharacterized protein n=1 Tax=Rhizopogon vesiculosus TaxID=180088 RepID=A0A1J8QT56_9AGAM|nr:hypothetical protein AZE42_12255 [Rhizopogon vesiculosus]
MLSSKMTASRRSSPYPAITPDLYGTPSRGLGVPIDVVGDQMTGSLGFRRVNLKILWPGYEHLDRIHPLDLYTPAGPFTRGQLAVQVAHAFARFMDELQGYPPAHHGATWRFR